VGHSPQRSSAQTASRNLGGQSSSSRLGVRPCFWFQHSGSQAAKQRWHQSMTTLGVRPAATPQSNTDCEATGRGSVRQQQSGGPAGVTTGWGSVPASQHLGVSLSGDTAQHRDSNTASAPHSATSSTAQRQRTASAPRQQREAPQDSDSTTRIPSERRAITTAALSAQQTTGRYQQARIPSERRQRGVD
jgi:hypothetical protein